MRVLVTGSRDWNNYSAIVIAINEINREATEPVTLVSGACPTGADNLAERYAELIGWHVERHPADWNHYGKSAGFRRNAEMVNAGASVCLAFIRNGSRGATHTAELADKARIPVRRFLA